MDEIIFPKMQESRKRKIRYAYKPAFVILLLIACYLTYENYNYLSKKITSSSGRGISPVPMKSIRRYSFTNEELTGRRIKLAEEKWKRLRKYRNKIERAYIRNDEPSVIWRFFNATFDCPHRLERIGNLGDGGKWICGLDHFATNQTQGDPCVVFSFGIADDTSFEQEILERTNCTVYTFDPSIDRHDVAIIYSHPDRANFDKIGLGYKDSKKFKRWTLKTSMRAHNLKFIDILKVDIEGYEFEALQGILRDFPDGLPFGQLLVELHIGKEMGIHVRFKNWWTSLEAAGLRPYSRELNVLGGSSCCYEFSFLNIKIDHRILHGADGA